MSLARIRHLADRMPSDGRWRILFFTGDITEPAQRAKLDKLAEYLDKPDGPIRKYTPADADIDSVIEVNLFFCSFDCRFCSHKHD
jgi:phenol 2-monooxygenase